VIKCSARSQSHKGPLQILQSRTCSRIRSGLVSILQALQLIQSSTKYHNTLTITICSQNGKLIHTLRKRKHQYMTLRNMMAPEAELYEEITHTLRRFKSYRSHRYTKSDKPSSSIHTLVQECIHHVKNSINPHPNTYRPSGLATIRINKTELSDNAEHHIRQAALSSGLHLYFESKYHWNDQTIATINWEIHTKALQSLPSNQRKTITQMIHEWLPVNAHPGRPNQHEAKSYQTCKHGQESQNYFLTCDQHTTPWEQAFNDTLHSQRANDNTLQNILHWALQQCRTLNKPFPSAPLTFQRTS
jgi:hypothetical protein